MKRQKYNMNPKKRRDRMVGVFLNEDEMKCLDDISNLWGYSYSSTLRMIILQGHKRLVEDGHIKEGQ